MTASEIFLMAGLVAVSVKSVRLYMENGSLKRWLRELDKPTPETQEAKKARLACAAEARQHAVRSAQLGYDRNAADHLARALEFERPP